MAVRKHEARVLVIAWFLSLPLAIGYCLRLEYLAMTELLQCKGT